MTYDARTQHEARASEGADCTERVDRRHSFGRRLDRIGNGERETYIHTSLELGGFEFEFEVVRETMARIELQDQALLPACAVRCHMMMMSR